MVGFIHWLGLLSGPLYKRRSWGSERLVSVDKATQLSGAEGTFHTQVHLLPGPCSAGGEWGCDNKEHLCLQMLKRADNEAELLVQSWYTTA